MSNFTIDGKDVDITHIPGGSITLREWKTVRANSAGFRELYPKLNNEALKHAVEHNLKNCTWQSDVVYEGTLHHVLIPLLLKRLP